MPSGNREADVSGQAILPVVFSVILFAAALIIKSSASVFMLILAALISGFDYIIEAVHDILDRNYLSRNVLLVLSCVVLFLIGANYEGGALFLASRIGEFFFSYAENRTRESSVSLLNYCSARDRDVVEDIIDNEESLTFNLYTISSSASLILKLTLIFALIFAASASFLFKFSFSEAVRRAIALIVICNTFSIEAFSKSLYTIAICQFANRGVFFKRPQDISDCAICDSVAIEKNRVLSGSCSGSVAVFSNVLDSDTMLSLCAHATFKSQQPFAKAISSKYAGEIHESLIDDFKEIPGIGVGVMLSGRHIILASNEFYSRKGINIPQEDSVAGIIYYLTIDQTYAGYITIGERLNEKYIKLTDIFKSAGVESVALVTDDDKDAAEQIAYDYGFDYFYPNCDENNASSALNDFAARGRNILYVNASTDIYQEAVCNISTEAGCKSNYVYNDSIDSLPWVREKSAEIKKVEEKNAVFVFVIKAFLLIVALSGIGSSWFSVFIDSVAAAITILVSWLGVRY